MEFIGLGVFVGVALFALGICPVWRSHNCRVIAAAAGGMLIFTSVVGLIVAANT